MAHLDYSKRRTVSRSTRPDGGQHRIPTLGAIPAPLMQSMSEDSRMAVSKRGSVRENVSEHRQTWVKVNAHVDEGVAVLITALGSFRELRTIESCEGDRSNGPWVCFTYGQDSEDWRALADFVLGYLGPGLVDAAGDLASVTIAVTSFGQPRAELAVRPGAIPEVASAVQELAANFRR